MRLAVIGDVHVRFDRADAEALDAEGYDAVLFAGDLAGYSHRGGLHVARAIATLRTPALVVPGNHDAVLAPQMLAEILKHERSIELLATGQRERVEELQRAIAPAVLGGFSVHPLRARSSGATLECVVARPHSFGGPHLAFRPYLDARFGVPTMSASAAKLCDLVERTVGDEILILAHNGPTGLGSTRDAIWGCDFRKGEGDFGDPDLREAIEHARAFGKRVVAVVAGHMHHALRGGGTRAWQARERETLFVNAAQVPRMRRAGAKTQRHHVELRIENGHAEATERWIDGPPA